MKILHIFNNVFALPEEGSGEKTHNQFMHQAFRKLGHAVVFFQPADYSPQSEKSIKGKRGIYRNLKKILPKKITDPLRDLYCILYDLFYDKKIIEIINNEKPDFIFERITAFHDSGLRAAKQAGIPFVIEIHETHNSLAYKDEMFFNWYRKYLWIKVAREADLVIVVSSMLRNYLVGESVNQDKIIVLPNAVDLDLFVVNNKRDDIRKQFNIYDDVVLGFVGCMHAYHGLELLPNLCRLLLDRNNNIKVLLVGSFDRWPGGEAAYRELLRAQRVEEKFILVGGVTINEVPGYIEALDIGLMPNSNEYGSPIKIFEYGSLGKPVVAARYSPIEDIIYHEINGLLFAPLSVDGMADQVEALIEDNELASRLGKQLKDDVVNNHTWEKNAASILCSLE